MGIAILTVFGMVRTQDIGKEVIQSQSLGAGLGRFIDRLDIDRTGLCAIRNAAYGVLVTDGRGLSGITIVAHHIPIRDCPEFW